MKAKTKHSLYRDLHHKVANSNWR